MLAVKFATLPRALGLALSGCTAMVITPSFVLKRAAGSARSSTVKLDNAASQAAIIDSGGNGGFVDSEGTSRMATRLAKVTGADTIPSGHPGR